MLPVLTSIAHVFTLNAWAMNRCVGDFSPTDWLVHDDNGHTARWIVGHLAVHRHRALQLMGLTPVPVPWDACFLQGTNPDAVPHSLDGIEIAGAFHAAHQVMTSRWASLSDHDICRPLGRALPDGGETMLDGLRFLAWHESYHVGQLGMLRRLTGKAAIA